MDIPWTLLFDGRPYCGLFLKCAADVHANDYSNLSFEAAIVDAGCVKLVQDPSHLDVLLLENFHGDVISALCAGQVSGLGGELVTSEFADAVVARFKEGVLIVGHATLWP